jgi:protein tyrosine/serine phosphatase
LKAPLTRDDLATPEGRRRTRRAFMLGDHGFVRALYRNAHETAPGLYRSAQPSPADIARWARRGVKTIVNLRGPAPSAALLLEEDACAREGLRLVNFRVYSREAPTPEILHGLRALFREIEHPALLHCKSGADRVGLAATLYLFFMKGAPLDAAMGQLSLRYGHIRQGKTGVIDRALDLYLGHARASGIALDDVAAFLAWADSPLYDPVAIKRDFRAGLLGGLLTEKILRRE